ncbi:FAD-binding and (Fe-S)-binding domain-containing protein [Qaidamihabitans albus]|uniref:FAD-binding and (Fe-S)-binding domain-containing protein n=1 Tax=Qaidamihabitans albus TaxID=2795733 RepID=UPI0018F23721|nr:FAD-binding and (Fe-S)-binding domain-containing protein [Qaidamihabitans albus]
MFVTELRGALSGEVEDGSAARAMYSQDASNYRHVPLAVVFPRDAADLETAVRLCHRHRVPVTMRGAGTSIAGQSLGEAIVVDCSRHLNRILEIDPERRIARVQPGVVLDRLREAAAEHGLTFGPDPSTHSRCTIGGMIGNDACGAHSVAWGRTADNVVALDLLTADGTALRADPELPGDGPGGEIGRRLRALAQDNLALLRQGFPALPRRVSGYALDALLPENGGDVVRALVGSEGTCALVTEATVRLVPAPAARVLVVAGYADDVAAADAVPHVLPLEPLTVEGMGADLLATLTATGRRPAALDRLPEGQGWLFVEVGGEDPAEAANRARELAAALREGTGASIMVADDPGEQKQLWSVREASAGIATRMPDGSEAWPGWEDAAVPPEHLGSYLRGFRALLRKYGLRGAPYGHFGEGCVHVRIDFALTTGEGIARFREFMTDAADLVVEHGGSLSGEHGDGQARAELLPRMYSPEIIELFEAFKGIWDPQNLLNPGNLVRPRALDADLRFDGPVRELPITLRYPQDGGSLATATRRCVGVGKCIDTSTGVMCPSYMATGEEQHSTRGRARLLFEMMRGDVITDGWRSEEVHEALDLCLACKGCLSDCPVNVDMAAYKAEFLHQHYRGRVRPASHYSLGFLPLWARLASAAPALTNAILGSARVSPLLKRLGGIAGERELPRFARASFRGAWRRHRPPEGERPQVVLWPDTFTNFLSPEVGVAAVRVLEYAGFDVRLPRGPVCCGLTWISTGQLDVARRVLRRSLRALGPDLAAGTPVVGLEPSCLAVFRHDAHDLLGADELRGVDRGAFTLAEFLERHAPDVEFPPLRAEAITQQHCHQHAVLGNAADERLLRRVGVDNRTLDSGCCGLAGNFGVERGHHEVSVAAAERVLVPEVTGADPDTLVLADGFSCRTQIGELTGRGSLHLAQVLDRAIAASR